MVFPDADFLRGCSSGELFATGEAPIEPWQGREKVLEQIDERLQEVAGIAVALDPYTLLMMFHADRDDGGKLAYIASQVPPEGLAGVVNIIVAGASPWIAGRDDCELLALVSQMAGGAPGS